MKNLEIIRVSLLKDMKLLYIENDKCLSEIDRDIIENVLNDDIDEYDIEYVFDAYKKDISNDIKRFNNILINTHFIGNNSSSVLVDFCKFAIENKLRDKKIFNCALFDNKKYLILDDMKDIINQLELNNISFYNISKDLKEFIKYTI
jgi:hypothetical protein